MDNASEQPVAPAAPAAARNDEASGDAAGFAVLDMVRAIAALAVVWNHAWNMVAGPMPAGSGPLLHFIYISAGFGLDAVFAFFVVSGFWIGKSVLARFSGGRWAWRDYLVDRLSRLMAVLVPALLLGGLLDLAGSRWLGLDIYRSIHVIGTSGFPVDETLTLATLVGNLVFLQGIVCPPFGSNVVLWSLSYEFWFYIWLPILLKLARRMRISWLELAVMVLSVVYLRLFLLAFPIWLLGFLTFALCYHQPRFRRWLGPVRGWGALTAAVLVWLGFLAASHLGNAGFLATGWLTGLGALPLVALAGRLRLPGLARLRWLSTFGAGSSYSLYAMHFPLLVLLVGLLPPALRQPGDALWIAPLLVLACVAAARGFSQLTEAQTPRVRRWLRAAVAGGGGRQPA